MTDFDRIEYTQLDDILSCDKDSSHPVLLTQEALDGTAAELVDCNRELVARALDRVDDTDAISQDALRSSYVDLYRAAMSERGLTWYRAHVPRAARELALQGLRLLGAPEHLDLAVKAIETDLDDEAFAAAFASAEAAVPLEEANAAYLRDLPAVSILKAEDIPTAMSIEFNGSGASSDYPRWRGDLSILE
ncbi:hypothetical protein [Brevibacterium casei]|uniref:hypothetical protein n=1 Tax=Brevibacterium casei TaxID=33889 RepID=UPI003700F643